MLPPTKAYQIHLTTTMNEDFHHNMYHHHIGHNIRRMIFDELRYLQGYKKVAEKKLAQHEIRRQSHDFSFVIF